MDANSISCKDAGISLQKYRPEVFMRKDSSCSFRKFRDYDTYILNCENLKYNEKSHLYTTKIGTCYELISSYKKDFTKE